MALVEGVGDGVPTGAPMPDAGWSAAAEPEKQKAEDARV